MSFLFINKTLPLSNLKLEQLRMRKFQCLLFVLKRSYICYYIITNRFHKNKCTANSQLQSQVDERSDFKRRGIKTEHPEER